MSTMTVCGSRLLANLGALMVVGGTARAQRPDSLGGRGGTTAVLRGRVIDQGTSTPVAGADVWLVAADRHVFSDSSGAFRAVALPPGLQLVQVRHLGFDVVRDTVMLSAEHENVRTYALVASSARLDTVRTIAGQERYLSPNLRGFEERRLSGQGGYFISDSVLRHNENMSLGNLIASRVPNVVAAHSSTRRTTVLLSGRKQCRGLLFVHTPAAVGGRTSSGCQGTGKSDCYIAIYLDGTLLFNAKMADAGAAPPDVDRELQATNLAGVEFYPDGAVAPAGMHSNDDGCGSLWLWTREK